MHAYRTSTMPMIVSIRDDPFIGRQRAIRKHGDNFVLKWGDGGHIKVGRRMTSNLSSFASVGWKKAIDIIMKASRHAPSRRLVLLPQVYHMINRYRFKILKP